MTRLEVVVQPGQRLQEEIGPFVRELVSEDMRERERGGGGGGGRLERDQIVLGY